ncbi:hypothetical protein ACFXTH_034812 [Malus domestica]
MPESSSTMPESIWTRIAPQSSSTMPESSEKPRGILVNTFIELESHGLGAFSDGKACPALVLHTLDSTTKARSKGRSQNVKLVFDDE